MKRSVVIATSAALALGIAAIGAVTLVPSFAAADTSAKHDSKACFDPNWVRGFQAKDDNTIIITSDDNQAYELQVGPACIGLDTSIQIAIRSRHGMMDICGPLDADIFYGDGGRDFERCPVLSVRHLQGDEATPYVYKARGEGKDEREQTRVNSGRDSR